MYLGWMGKTGAWLYLAAIVFGLGGWMVADRQAGALIAGAILLVAGTLRSIDFAIIIEYRTFSLLRHICYWIMKISFFCALTTLLGGFGNAWLLLFMSGITLIGLRCGLAARPFFM